MRLSAVLENYKWAKKLTARDMAAQIGITPAIYTNFEDGKNVSANALAKIIAWLLADPDPPAITPSEEPK